MRLFLWCWALSLSAGFCAVPPVVPGLPVPAGPPMQQAKEAWVELAVRGGAGVLAQLEMMSPRGQWEWVTNRQGAATDAVVRLRLPVVPFGWTSYRVQWLPEREGEVVITLTAPRERSTNGMVVRQDVVFDDFRVTGILLTNASFEQYVGNRPVGWEGGGVVNAGPLPPHHEANYARVWCERPLRQRVLVRSNVPVTLQWAVRAMPLLGPEAMKPLMERNTLAHQAAAFYKRGVNVSHFLELPPKDARREECTVEDFAQMKREGFDHMRLPVAWHHYAGPAPDYVLDAQFLKRVDLVASNALSQGLFVILAMTAPEALHARPQAYSNQWVALWRQLARHYAEAHPGLALELLDEPREAATTSLLNGWYAEALKYIRAQNPMRTVFLGPGEGNGPEALAQLHLPPEEENVIVTVHCWEPRYFTRQSDSSEGGAVGPLKGVVYPGPPSAPLPVPLEAGPALRRWLEVYNRRPAAWNPSGHAVVEGQLQLARDWSEFYGRPVHVGAFGVTTAADSLSRARYMREVRQLAAAYGLGWAVWAWRGGYDYWDKASGRPLPGMREALFGR